MNIAVIQSGRRIVTIRPGIELTALMALCVPQNSRWQAAIRHCLT